jgi:hypothetical protein
MPPKKPKKKGSSSYARRLVKEVLAGKRPQEDLEKYVQGTLDPLKTRRGLTTKPKVIDHKDFESRGLIRVLLRKDRTCFPEFAFYPRSSPSIEESLVDAGFKEEKPSKWVLRTNKFNIFVYF